jgi:hypothetical protein
MVPRRRRHDQILVSTLWSLDYVERSRISSFWEASGAASFHCLFKMRGCDSYFRAGMHFPLPRRHHSGVGANDSDFVDL